MITPEEVVPYINLKQVEEYIDSEIKKGNLHIRLDMFNQTLTPESLDSLIKKYEA